MNVHNLIKICILCLTVSGCNADVSVKATKDVDKPEETETPTQVAEAEVDTFTTIGTGPCAMVAPVATPGMSFYCVLVTGAGNASVSIFGDLGLPSDVQFVLALHTFVGGETYAFEAFDFIGDNGVSQGGATHNNGALTFTVHKNGLPVETHVLTIGTFTFGNF